jgi:hypothetical protein
MTPPPETEKPLGQIVSEATEKASLLVREEIELAKAEITSKVKTLGRGAAVGAAAGVFLFFAFIFFLHTLSWFWVDLFNFEQPWFGFAITTLILVVLGVIAGLLAKKWLSTGPPTPDMAIQEAKVTKEELEQVATETPKLEEKT